MPRVFSDFNLQPVVRQPDMRRQTLLRAGVSQIVADVREERAPGRQLLHRFERPLHGGMRGMRLMPQRVQEQHIQTAQQFHGLLAEYRCDPSDTPRSPKRNPYTVPLP